jgi:ferredoxin
VPGEELDKVMNRLFDPKDYAGKDVLVVGGGDSAAEAAIALTACGARVTLAYRGESLNRPKPENIEQVIALSRDPGAPVAVTRPTSERVTTAASSEMRGDMPAGSLTLALGKAPTEISARTARLKSVSTGETEEIANDYVFSMIGREAPLDFFRRNGITISGDWTKKSWITATLAVVFGLWLYHWKKWYLAGTPLDFDPAPLWNGIASLTTGLQVAAADKGSLFYTIKQAFSQRDTYYSLTYCMLVLVFGLRRMARRKTPYVARQTWTLIAIQWVPLFILPVLLLPWMGNQGFFAEGAPLRGFADLFFDLSKGADPRLGADREYWRSYGFIFAWPLLVGNWFTAQPMIGWLVVGFIQTFVLIPLLVWRWGKGAYCGWICSCGALAETLGDQQRHKMPHGPKTNRWNMVGQLFLGFAFVLLALRILGWIFPSSPFGTVFMFLYKGLPLLSYDYFVDLLWSGVIGVSLYFHLSGRVWCRFACPLAALMHIYARFTRFRIFAEKSKCISCNVCTSVCHQGIDIMNFANKGLPMTDPECVRCSACVQQCPTGVLSFGHLDGEGVPVLDRLAASRVQLIEKKRAVH